MESKQIRSSVIAKSMAFNGLFQPLQPYSREESFLSTNSSKQGQERLRVIERQKQPKGFIQKWNLKSNSGFTVIPTKELCRVYLQKPDLLASKGVIDAEAKPPHSQKKGLKIYGEMANQRKFGRRFDQQSLKKSKLRYHHTSVVDPLKPKLGKKENSLRYFSPLGFGSASGLRDMKKGQCLSFEKKPKEMKKLCDGATFGQKKDRVAREVGSKLMVSTSRDSVLSLERIGNDRVAADVKLRHVSSSGFTSKDENKNSLDCSNASTECQTNSEEAHQPSPVSVLEPMFNEDMLDDDSEESSPLDFHGLEKQLETLKSESNSYSEGSGMEVSNDEESVLDSESKEDSEPIGFLDTEESRDSSYIDDILAEAVLGDKNSVPDKQGSSLDLVVTPKIFEKLENKYYTETSWKRSERRILFDRASSGLVEILESLKATPTWKKPVSRRLGTVLNICGLKQELWKVLARQEKRAKKESLTKVPVIVDIDEWLELEADDEPVVCELESMIIDELLAEVFQLHVGV